jgi:hypothetical protein
MDFDVAALHAALDQQRKARGLTWAQLTREINGQCERLPLRSIASSTIAGMRKRQVLEGDGVLQMLRWLGRAPEDFVPGHPQSAPGTALPPVARGRILRFDLPAIYAAIDAKRAERGMTWAETAREIGGFSVAGLTRMAKGGRTAFPHVVRIARWLRRPVATLTRTVDS